MSIHVGEASPPHRDRAIAEFHVMRDGEIEIPAELYWEGDKVFIALYGRTDGVAWEYPLEDFVRAIDEGRRILDAPQPPLTMLD